jgi:hypothetical protein
MVALDHRPHGTVEHHNPSAEQRLELAEASFTGTAHGGGDCHRNLQKSKT